MKKFLLLFLFSLSVFIYAQATKDFGVKPIPAPTGNLIGNPFLEKSKLPYGAPDFSKIRDYHYQPAFDYGLKVQTIEIENITENPEKPTFENTVLALENSGEILKRAQSVFFNITGVSSDYQILKLMEQYAPIFAKHNDAIFMNQKLYARIKAVKTSGLDYEDRKLIEFYRSNFALAGAEVKKNKRDKLKSINAELASLSTQYQNKLIRAKRKAGIVITDLKELDGLTKEEIARATNDAKNASHAGKYLLTISETTQQNYLKNLKNRKLRERIYNASRYRAEQNDENDTRATLERIAKLRVEKARLLGHRTFASWKLQNQMIKSPDKALNILSQIAAPAVKTAKIEKAELQNIVDRENGGFKIEPWDWNYYAEKLKAEKFGMTGNDLKPYFSLNKVLEDGVFFAAQKFYGISFEKRKDLPVYHSDVSVYEVIDNNGKPIALYYLDLYARTAKAEGAWMTNFVEQASTKDQKPVVLNVFNYPKPIGNSPTLLNLDEVRKLFHEFGHALHGFFADGKYASISGTNTPKDFVEFPSQFNEFFAYEPAVLQNYAKHYRTGKSLSAEQISTINALENFNIGYRTTELVAAATLDLKWHSIRKEKQVKPTAEFEESVLEKSGFNKAEVPLRYYSPYFAHIWGDGYSAGYYAYVWSDILSYTAWEYVKNHGGMKREIGDRFRKNILSVGNATDLNLAFRNFAGKDPDIRFLLKSKGFK